MVDDEWIIASEGRNKGRRFRKGSPELKRELGNHLRRRSARRRRQRRSHAGWLVVAGVLLLVARKG